MRILFILILSCTSLFAGDQGVRVVTTAVTNAVFITTKEVFTREGQTNLVRQTTTQAGTVTAKIQSFYHDGSQLATFLVVTPHYSQFFTKPDSSYLIGLDFSPSNQINYLTFCSNKYSVVEAFSCTNGNFYPESSTVISEMNALPHEVTAMPRLPTF